MNIGHLDIGNARRCGVDRVLIGDEVGPVGILVGRARRPHAEVAGRRVRNAARRGGSACGPEVVVGLEIAPALDRFQAGTAAALGGHGQQTQQRQQRQDDRQPPLTEAAALRSA